MNARSIDPDVQAILDEANALPDCAACDALLERAAARAEALDDLDTAWQARCRILSSTAAHSAPKFESLFMCLAWCLALSDREPARFDASAVLWQYKWVATAAPEYASVPRGVLERSIDDMDERFVRAGWGRRAGVHKRLELFESLGEPARALELVPVWKSIPRDRGSDCNACECQSMVRLRTRLGDDEAAVREAASIIAGRLRCSTVPHSTFGTLLAPLTRLGRHATAKDLYDRGRRLVAAMHENGCTLAGPYLLHAACVGEVDDALAMLRTRFRQGAALRSDRDRMEWFARAGAALRELARRGVERASVPITPGLTSGDDAEARTLGERCTQIALTHARALDARDGRPHGAAWVERVGDAYRTV